VIANPRELAVLNLLARQSLHARDALVEQLRVGFAWNVFDLIDA
jgi:hypothetical protein